MHYISLRKRRERGREKLFEEIITEKSSYLGIQVRGTGSIKNNNNKKITWTNSLVIVERKQEDKGRGLKLSMVYVSVRYDLRLFPHFY